jgi:hypothetical protein
MNQAQGGGLAIRRRAGVAVVVDPRLRAGGGLWGWCWARGVAKSSWKRPEDDQGARMAQRGRGGEDGGKGARRELPNVYVIKSYNDSICICN